MKGSTTAGKDVSTGQTEGNKGNKTVRLVNPAAVEVVVIGTCLRLLLANKCCFRSRTEDLC